MTNPSEPPAIHQTSTTNTQDVASWCPFCTIATHFQPINTQDYSNPAWDPDKLSPPAYVILSTEHVIAFLDIAPLTRGHVLVAPRKHRTKIGDFRPNEMAEIGRVLPVIARGVLRATLPDIPHDDVDYNIVQNNGPGAAQVIPHVHFHIIPRPPLNYVSQPTSSTPPTLPPKTKKYPRSALPTGIQQSYIQFGRGQRHELDDDDAAVLVQSMRRCVADEWKKDFPTSSSATRTEDTEIERFVGGAEDAAWIEGGAGLVRNLERRGGVGSDEQSRNKEVKGKL